MTDNKQPTTAELEPVVAADEDYFTAYANAASVAHTFFDFQLHFSEVKVRGPQDIRAETFATIMMSPQHAKAFFKHLSQNLELYEERYGEIKLPDVLNIQSADIDLTKAKSE